MTSSNDTEYSGTRTQAFLVQLSKHKPLQSITVIVLVLVLATVVVGLLFTSGSSSSACGPSGVCVPVGNVPGWNQIYETDFPGKVPVGAFSGCGYGTDAAQTYCAGLRRYGSYYDDWWAYPSGWPDTAQECIENNDKCPYFDFHPPVGGFYEPQDAVSVGGGAMHIRMHRPDTGGSNVVATVVPKACMDQLYGMYTERFKVIQEDPGFQSAHLFYQGGFEIDFPENPYGTTISAYTHPGGANFSTRATWTQWHTSKIEWTSHAVSFYLDGRLVGTTSKDVPDIPMTWILQNESSIKGPYAQPGARAELDIAWVACYAPA